MRTSQAVKPAYEPIAYETVSVHEANQAVADKRPVYNKNWAKMRLPAPAVRLLDSTRAWLGELPQEVHTIALAECFPRIANNLARLWRHPVQWERYMTDLLVVRRGDTMRQGFPRAVARELAALSSYYMSLHPANGDVFEWSTTK